MLQLEQLDTVNPGPDSGRFPAACHLGMAVVFTKTPVIADELMEARNEGCLLHLQRQLSRPNLLIIDDRASQLCYAPAHFCLSRNSTSAGNGVQSR